MTKSSKSSKKPSKSKSSTRQSRIAQKTLPAQTTSKPDKTLEANKPFPRLGRDILVLSKTMKEGQILELIMLQAQPDELKAFCAQYPARFELVTLKGNKALVKMQR